MEDPYSVMGVPRDADAEEIRKAYRKLALRYHPDKGGDQDTFKRISEAYGLLSDPEKRERYDRFGHVDENFVDPSDVFDSLFGNLGGVFKAFNKGSRKRRKTVRLEVSLEEAFRGKKKVVEIERQVVDQTKTQPCAVCGGGGRSVKVQVIGMGMLQQVLSECEECQGLGKRVDESGVRVVKESATICVPPFCPEGFEIVLKGKMDEYPGEEPGDIVFEVAYKPHPTFSVAPNGDLLCKLSINLPEALDGFVRYLKHLDGTYLRLQVSGRVTRPFSKYTVFGAGFERDNEIKNLTVVFEVEFPETVAEPRSLGRVLGVQTKSVPVPPSPQIRDVCMYPARESAEEEVPGCKQQ